MFLGDGEGNLILPGHAFKTGKRPYQRLRSADFNKDGKLDVVTNRFGSEMPLQFCSVMARAVCVTRPARHSQRGRRRGPLQLMT